MSNFDRTVSTMKGVLTDPVKFQNFVRNHKKDIFYWGLLVLAVITIYFVASDGDFSFFLTLSGIVQMFGFLLIALRVRKSRDVGGLSMQTMICYAVSLTFKAYSILFWEGYLPLDSSGDFVYRFVETSALGLSIFLIYLMLVKFKSTYNKELDKVNCALLIAPTFFLALFVHPSVNSSYTSDVAWAFSLYLESIAMFPQIYLFSKKGGEIESYTSHYVASQTISRVLAFVFWLFSFHELNEVQGDSWGILKGYVGHITMLAQLIQLVIVGDFIYHYFQSVKKGVPMTLPTYVV